jgi:hypothetical protein
MSLCHPIPIGDALEVSCLDIRTMPTEATHGDHRPSFSSR